MTATDRDARRWEAACAAMSALIMGSQFDARLCSVAVQYADALLAAFERSQPAVEPAKRCSGTGFVDEWFAACPGCVDCQPPKATDGIHVASLTAVMNLLALLKLRVTSADVAEALHKAGLRLEPVQTR